jgi:hypothetical protein
MAYLKHQPHGTHGNGAESALAEEGQGAPPTVADTEPSAGPAMSGALLAWIVAFTFLTVAILWDLIAAMFFRSA